MRTFFSCARFRSSFFILCTFFATLSCAATPRPADPLAPIARQFVLLGLAVANKAHDQYLYFGPQAWRSEAQADTRSAVELQTALEQLQQNLIALPPASTPRLAQRRQLLLARIEASVTRAKMLQGQFPASFDEETRLLFGADVPARSEAHFQALIAELEQLIPGEGALPERMAHFRDQFVIPVERLESVMTRAMQECKQRTQQFMPLPAGESVTLNLTEDKPWVGFTEYHGDGTSTVHINRSVPVHIERALELGCHEAYPGHHTHAAVMTDALVRREQWQEFTFIPLYGPQAIIAEGIASYAPFLVFSEAQRQAFEKDTLLPLAGLDASQFEIYSRYLAIKHELIYSWNEAARRHLYGGMSKSETIQWLVDFGLETEATATQRVAFIGALRSYVISYNYGMALVKQYVEREGGDDIHQRWAAFNHLMTTPLVPAELQQP